MEHYYEYDMDPKDWDKFKKQCKDAAITLFWTIVICLLALTCTGCTTTKYVPIEFHTTDTIYQNKLKYDSIYLHDSVFVETFQKGDTVYRTRDRWRTQFVERLKTDTMYKAVHDSIPVPYPERVEVEKKLHFWQKALMWEGGIFMALLAVLFGVWLKKRW